MNNPPWRVITDIPQSAARNMATDEAIATAFSEGKAPATLRLYRWETPSFSIGAFQKLEADWIALLEAKDIDMIRRMTGGRGLLHDDELTYSLVSSTSHPLFSAGIKGTFQSIAKGLIYALDQLAVEAKVESPFRSATSKQKKPLCFDVLSAYEITAQGKKLIGSAQRRWKKHFLQHGALVLKKSDAIQIGSETGLQKLVSDNQITLSDLMNGPLIDKTLVDAVKDGFENAFSITLKAGTLSPYEENLVRQLRHEKYDRPAWNLCRDKIDRS